jgi:ketosteroid isomerase-like protein
MLTFLPRAAAGEFRARFAVPRFEMEGMIAMTSASIASVAARSAVRAALAAALIIVFAPAARGATSSARGRAAGAPPAAAKRPPAGPVDEIKSFEEACNKAYERNDLKAYFDCYTDDMTQFYQQGRLDLPEYRRLWEKEIADGGGIVEVRLADMTIQMGPSNDAAVAVYRIFAKQRHPDGTVTEGWNEESDVLFRRGGRWRIAHVHYSDAPKEAPGGAR